jgi:hypothetical protein
MKEQTAQLTLGKVCTSMKLTLNPFTARPHFIEVESVGFTFQI